jgi:phosphoribosylformylglycinamidine synthase
VTQRIEIGLKRGVVDARGRAVAARAHRFLRLPVASCRTRDVYKLDLALSPGEFRKIRTAFTDPVICRSAAGRLPPPRFDWMVEVGFRPGVTDNVGSTARAVARDVLDRPLGRDESVYTSIQYFFRGALERPDVEHLSRDLLANPLIHSIRIFSPGEWAASGIDLEVPAVREQSGIRVGSYDLSVSDAQLLRISREGILSLSLEEMHAVRDYFASDDVRRRREAMGLPLHPTDVELECIAQTWSEHCKHKIFAARVHYVDETGAGEWIDSLFKTCIRDATAKIGARIDWLVSVFSDNAGIIRFNDRYHISCKVETHNSPSALDPYGGAITGIVGVNRDPMGTGMGARPIANTDIFCFGRPDKSLDEIPKGVLHPRRIMRGVVAGVRDYGNRMGIPTVNGAIYFDDRYMANPLVYCGNVGIMDKTKAFKHQQAGNLIVVVGGRTGRDGIHGATFSSGQMTHEHETIFSHAVQIGNAITEKKMLDVLIQANEAGLYEAITDCGAGGLSSAVGEMGSELGAEVELEKVPLKYTGLSYTEIWISEAQERMVLAVKPENLDAIQRIFAGENVESTVIGRFTGDGKLRLRYDGQQVGELDMSFLHDGVPKYKRQAVWTKPRVSEPTLAEKDNYNDDLLQILSSFNVASKEWVIRQYDHEVQGGSVVKPLMGVANDGPSDAAVVQPKFTSRRGVALSCGMNPLYGDIDPYWMALAGIDEAIRNLVCVGGRVDRIALLDNFCWARCTDPEVLGSLVRAAQACYDGAMAFQAPFISGKDSLNNEFVCEDGSLIRIPPTLLISAMSLVDDIDRCVTMDLKKPGNILFIVGRTNNELGGSHFYQARGHTGANVPKLDLTLAPKIARQIASAIADGLVASCHDCSEGGLAVALGEMAFAGGLGAEADLRGLPRGKDCSRTDVQLFSESNSRYLVEVAPKHFDAFAKKMLNLPFGQLGVVTETPSLVVKDADGRSIIDAQIDQLKQAWQKTFNW